MQTRGLVACVALALGLLTSFVERPRCRAQSLEIRVDARTPRRPGAPTGLTLTLRNVYGDQLDELSFELLVPQHVERVRMTSRDFRCVSARDHVFTCTRRRGRKAPWTTARVTFVLRGPRTAHGVSIHVRTMEGSDVGVVSWGYEVVI